MLLMLLLPAVGRLQDGDVLHLTVCTGWFVACLIVASPAWQSFLHVCYEGCVAHGWLLMRRVSYAGVAQHCACAPPLESEAQVPAGQARH
jgi:hypothetical protein